MKLRFWGNVVAVAVLLVSAQASADVITFEDAHTRVSDTTGQLLGDNDKVTTEYKQSDGIAFFSGILEKVGDNGPNGFLNDVSGNWDDPVTNTPVPPQGLGLGNWFLRSDGLITDRGGEGVYLRIGYVDFVTAASGQVWDIDGNSSQGSEAWAIKAYMDNNNGDYSDDQLVASISSDEYSVTGNTNSLNGQPWNFSLSSGQAFNRLDFVFTGSKETGVGLAFDNFNYDSAAIITTPTPAAIWLFALGVVCLGVGLASRRTIDNQGHAV